MGLAYAVDAMSNDLKPSEKQTAEVPRYETDYLIRNARALLGSRGPVVAGALAETTRKTHTIKQAEDAIKSYLKAERPEEGRVTEDPEEDR